MMFASNIHNKELEPFHKLIGVDFTISLTDLLQSRLFEVETIIENKIYRAYTLFHCNEIISTNPNDKIIENKCLILEKRERETYLSFTTNNNTKINLTHELEDAFCFYGIGDKLTSDEFNKYVYSLRENTVLEDTLNLNDNYISHDDVHIDLSVFANYKNNIILNNLSLKGVLKKLEDDSLLKNKTLKIYNYTGEGWNLIRSVNTNSDGEYSFTDYSFVDFIDNSSVGSRDELQSLITNAINNNIPEITLNKQYRFNNGDSFITIPDSLKINGNGHIINADGKSRLFEVTGDNVVLDNLILKNGNINTQGGCIKWSGDNGKLSNAVIVNCISDNHGGGIYWTGEHGVIQDTRFVNNATNGDGGCIYADGDNFKILNIICFNNFAGDGRSCINVIGDNAVIDGVIAEKNTGNGVNRGVINNSGDNADIFNIDAFENYFGQNRIDRTSKSVDNKVQYKIVLSTDNKEYYSTENGFNLLTRTANSSHGETKGIINCKSKYANYIFYNTSNKLVNNEGIIITDDLKNNPLRVKVTDSFFEFANHNLTFTVKNLNDADINDLDNEDNILDSFTLKLNTNSEVIIPLNDYENDSVLLFNVDVSIDFHVLEIQRRNLLKLISNQNRIYSGDSILLTATYLDPENNPLTGEEVILKANDTVLDTITTDNTGVASFEYTPSESCSITAECEDIHSRTLNVTVEEFDGVSLSGDKSVLSYYNRESCNLTAQLTLDGEPVCVSGVNVIFVAFKASDDSMLDSLSCVTGADGSCTRVYESTGSGDVYFKAYAHQGRFVSETYVIEDLSYYDNCTSDKNLWNSNKSDMIYEYTNDGMCFYAPSRSDNILTAKYELPQDYIAEFTYMGGSSYQISMYFSDSFIQTNPSTNNYGITTHYGTATTTINQSVQIGDVFKVVKQGNTVKYYQNDVEVFTGTLTDPNNELRRYSYSNKSNRYTFIKDIKIKAL